MISPYTYIACKYDDIVFDEETDTISFYYGSACISVSSADFKARHLRFQEQTITPIQGNMSNRLKFEL